MHSTNSTPTPAMGRNCVPSMANYFYELEMQDVHDEQADWLLVAAPASVPQPDATVRKAEEIAFIPAMFEGDVHERFGLHPECVLALFRELPDTSWELVLRCDPPLRVEAPVPAFELEAPSESDPVPEEAPPW